MKILPRAESRKCQRTWLFDLIGPTLLLIFFTVTVLLVPPRGEFASNDDWDYFATVSDFLEHGEIRLSDWPAMTLIGQVWWGGLFSKFFGLSYMTLRFSVISLLFLGALALYYWARAINRSRIEAIFLSLLYATSPLVFNLSYSFMTDVPGTSMMLLCLLVQAHCIRRGGMALHLLAGVTAGTAYLFRQTAAVPALVFAAGLLLAVLRKQARVRDLSVLCIPLVLVVIWHGYWLDHIHGRPYNATVDRLGLLRLVFLPGHAWEALTAISQQLLLQSVIICIYLAPLLLCLVGRRAGIRVWQSRKALGLISAVLLGIPTLMALNGLRLPPGFTQYVGDFYLGFETIHCGDAFRGFWIQIGSLVLDVFSVLTVAGLASLSLAAGLLFVSFSSPKQTLSRSERRVFTRPETQAGFCTLVLMGLLVIQSPVFDRYLIPVIPVAAMFLLSLVPRDQGMLRSPLSWGFLVLFGIFSIAGTQEYLVRGQARQRAESHLADSGIRPSEINAGFEHAALCCYSPHYRQPTRVRPYLCALPENERQRRLDSEDPSSVWMRPKRYVLTYDFLGENGLLTSVPYHAWFRSGAVYVYDRKINL